ncbi:E3 ubiquitin-protein ligase RING1-like [Macadamia integrifolia]|uniref:E3 ubiquitin-protein ligase RING1-like n=1 Tax=Macadamia integrifolia TaxID=60698 RepID=UPI001C4FC984|nr:E3 ubiquitin-protein ligase RING1-like [Macadamia integrifolia]XP_042501419.1 E3 ubiquitin-protein ligase RING1-like [Macadamia integrifolia]XP_042501420.1 E3 ubiquitin-protein ligase RING1-like [Macadamia integrifolia]XP_042501421.1 E3 ubiquitin-protein ligase RING1-like [Macadamia integrifolia]
MSSAGISGGAAGGATPEPQFYFCHECNHNVSITPSLTSDLVCPDCNGGFIEECENPTPTHTDNPFFTYSHSFSSGGAPFPSLAAGLAGLPFLLSTPGTMEVPTELSALFDPEIRQRSTTTMQEPDVFNPFLFLQNYLQSLRAGGANIQFVVENNPSDSGGFRLPSNLGDYFIGPGLEQLIQQLAENDPNRYGTPPASKSAIEALPNVKISEELLASDSAQCAVCKDTFELGMEARQMPCKHIYHSDCILPWLELHNSCPVCRYELPTDDPDYEQRTRETRPSGNLTVGSGSTDSGSGRGETQENNPPPRMAQRRFSISLPSLFRSFAGQAEASNSGDGSNSGNNESNTGSQGSRDFGSETRQEDLD